MINVDSRLIDPENSQRLDADELYMAIQITKRINKERTCFPSIKTLSKDSGFCIDKTQVVLKRLESKGIITKKQGGGRHSNLYTVLSPLLKNYLGGENNPGDFNLQQQAGNITPQPPDNLTPQRGDKSGKEVLDIDDINNLPIEQRVLERKKRRLSIGTNLIFEALIKYVYTQFEEYRDFYSDPEYVFAKGLTDQTIISTLKKISGAAEKLYSAFDQLKRPIPEYREIGMIGGAGELDPSRESVDQLSAYVDFCELTGTYTTQDPDKLCDKLVQANWCEKLLAWADDKVKKQEYDPAYDSKIVSQWLIEYFYVVVIAYGCKRYSNRVVYAGTEYLSTKDDQHFDENGRRKQAMRNQLT